MVHRWHLFWAYRAFKARRYGTKWKMMSPKDFLDKAYRAAVDAGHVFPEFAACEAALESAWGNSKLCILGNNLFGQKSGGTTREWPTIPMPTKENVDLNHDGVISPEEVVTVQSDWVKF